LNRMRLKWGLKGLESRLRGFRAHLQADARRSLRQLLQERLTGTPLAPGRWAWIDIWSLDYDGPQGRLFYSVFVMLERAGFQIALRPNQAFLSSFQRRPIKALLLGRAFPLVADPALLPEGYWWITDHPRKPPPNRPAKTVHLLR
jgi:hypothetical protein